MRPTLESHARELLELPPEWEAFRWEVKGRGVYIEGAVPNGVFKRGPRKGHTNWKLRDKATEAAIIISDDQHNRWLTNWEATTGQCYLCIGTTQEWAGWSAKDGSRYRPCTRCDATGLAQPTKPISARGGRCA